LVVGGSEDLPPSQVSSLAEGYLSEEYLSHTSKVAELFSFLVPVAHSLLLFLKQLKLPLVP
jgi:hypothetical protein